MGKKPQKIIQAIARRLPPPADQEWMLETTVTVKIILKNRIWSE